MSMSEYQHLSGKERRQYFVSHVTTSHKSVDVLDSESVAERPTSLQEDNRQVPDYKSDITRERSSSFGSPICESKPFINTSSIGLVSKSPFLSKTANFNVKPTPFGAYNPTPLVVGCIPKQIQSTPPISNLPSEIPEESQDKETNKEAVDKEAEKENIQEPVTVENTLEITVGTGFTDNEPQILTCEAVLSCERSSPPVVDPLESTLYLNTPTEVVDLESTERTECPEKIEEKPSDSSIQSEEPYISEPKPLARQKSTLTTTLTISEMPVDVKPTIIHPNDSSSADVLFDPWCDPENPRVIQFQDISAAAFKIKSGIMCTPCTRSHLSNITETQLFFKKDFLQYTGSFKERGARYTLLMLPVENQKQGVIAASAGNHALALSYHGQELGIPVTVVMPIVAPIMKVQSCRQFGANVIIHGKDIGESRECAMKLAKEKSLTYINGYDHPHIIAGQGTMGLEIVEQVKNVDAVVVPVGGGGLIAGVALAVKSLYPHIKVIGVESERCSSFRNALQAGKPIYTKPDSTLADGLAVPKVGGNALAIAAPLVDKCVVVKEEFIAMAILRLVEVEKAVVEGAGACGLAALLAGHLPELKGKRVVIPLCGGNIDTTVLGRCLERGLAVDGRLVKFSVTVSDRPGGIAELCRLLASMGVSIKDILHERAWLKSDIFSVEVRVMCETRDLEHAVELERTLKEHYNYVHFGQLCDMTSGGLSVELQGTRSPLV